MVGHMHTVRCLQVNYSLVQLFIPAPHLILRHEGETGQTTSSPSFAYSVVCDVKKKIMQEINGRADVWAHNARNRGGNHLSHRV